MLKFLKIYFSLRLKKGGKPFNVFRLIYKKLQSLAGGKTKRLILKLKNILLSDKTSMSAVIMDKRFPVGCLIEFKNKKFWWRDPANPYHLLTSIINNGGNFETKESELFEIIVKNGNVVMDIGASFGWHSVDFMRLAGKKGEVYCFESGIESYEELSINIKLNSDGQHNVILERVAIGNENKETKLYVPEKLGSAFATLIPDYYSKLSSSRAIKIKMIRLDDYIKRRGIKKIDFIKCDVEGSQDLVIEGASKLLSDLTAPIIYMEINKEDNRDIFYRLQNFGYNAYFFTGKYLKLINNFKDELPDYNFLFAKQKHLQRINSLIK